MRTEQATVFKALNGRRYFTAKAAALKDAVFLVKRKYPDDFSAEEYAADRHEKLIDRIAQKILRKCRQEPKP